MRFFLVIGAFLLASLIPSMAWSGAVPLACDGSIQPVYDTNGYSGVRAFESGGYVVGFNMRGTTVQGTGDLPRIDSTAFEGSSVALVGGPGFGWPDLDGNGITDQVVVDLGAEIVRGAFPAADGDFVTNPAYATPLLPYPQGQGYRATGFPDLDGDGKTDHCVQHIASGYNYCYGMDGTTVLWQGALPSPQEPGYRTLGFPDLDGQNGADICLQHEDGYTFCYIIELVADAPTVTASGPIPAFPEEGYLSLAFPDLNFAGGREYCIQYANSGFTYCYQLDTAAANIGAAFTVAAEGQIPGPPDLTYATVGFPQLDFANGDDHCIQHSSGYTVCYLVPQPWNNLVAWTSGPIPSLPDGYINLGFPDLDCDGKQDLVIQDVASKYTVAHLMDGLTAAPGAELPPLGNPAFSVSEWTVIGKQVLPVATP